MATKAATSMLQRLLMVALVIQWSSLHAASLPEDYYYGTTRQDAATQDYTDQFTRDPDMPSDYNTQDDALLADLYDFSDRPRLLDTEWATQSDMPSFAKESSAWDQHPGATGADTGWESFTIQESRARLPREPESATFAYTETEGTDTFVDSSAVTNPLSSFADDKAFIQPAHNRDAYENDEVYFDTSSADMVYKASGG